MLYDLATDPNELRDLGADPACEAERRRLMTALNAWGLRLSQRTTRSEEQIKQSRGKSQRRGILIGVWDESEVGRTKNENQWIWGGVKREYRKKYQPRPRGGGGREGELRKEGN